MSTYPQNKFTIPDISGKWKYSGNIQTLTATRVSPIKTLTGIVDFTQNNLFFNYTNSELGITRVGVLSQNNNCINGKLITQWVGDSVNSGDSTTLHYTPYCYKNGKPTKMISSGTNTGPYDPHTLTFIENFNYERV
jgi:hypothetical protein